MEETPKHWLWTLCREIFANLPVVFVLFTAFRLMQLSLIWLSPPRYGWAWTIVFPLFWVYAFLWVRLYLHGDIKNRHSIMYIFTAGTLAAAVVIVMLEPGTLPTLDDIILRHEYTTFLWVSLLMIHCVATRGISGFAMFFMIGFLYGALLESSGIHMGVFFEPDYHWYMPAVLRPVFTARWPRSWGGQRFFTTPGLSPAGYSIRSA